MTMSNYRDYVLGLDAHFREVVGYLHGVADASRTLGQSDLHGVMAAPLVAALDTCLRDTIAQLHELLAVTSKVAAVSPSNDLVGPLRQVLQSARVLRHGALPFIEQAYTRTLTERPRSFGGDRIIDLALQEVELALELDWTPQRSVAPTSPRNTIPLGLLSVPPTSYRTIPPSGLWEMTGEAASEVRLRLSMPPRFSSAPPMPASRRSIWPSAANG